MLQQMDAARPASAEAYLAVSSMFMSAFLVSFCRTVRLRESDWQRVVGVAVEASVEIDASPCLH